VIALTVQAVSAVAFRVQQAFTFVKTDGAGGDIKLFGQFRNGVEFVAVVVARVSALLRRKLSLSIWLRSVMGWSSLDWSLRLTLTLTSI